MAIRITQNKQYPNSKWAERKRDLLLVSSFGFWAAMLGLAPVLAVHVMMGS